MNKLNENETSNYSLEKIPLSQKNSAVKMNRREFLKNAVVAATAAGALAGLGSACSIRYGSRTSYSSPDIKDPAKQGVEWINKAEYTYDPQTGVLQFKLPYQGFTGNWSMQIYVRMLNEWREKATTSGTMRKDSPFIEGQIDIGQNEGRKNVLEIIMVTPGNSRQENNTITQKGYFVIDEQGNITYTGNEWKEKDEKVDKDTTSNPS